MSAVAAVVFGLPGEFALIGAALLVQAFLVHGNTAAQVAFIAFGVFFSLICFVGLIVGCCVYWAVKKKFRSLVQEALDAIERGELPS